MNEREKRLVLMSDEELRSEVKTLALESQRYARRAHRSATIAIWAAGASGVIQLAVLVHKLLAS